MPSAGAGAGVRPSATFVIYAKQSMHASRPHRRHIQLLEKIEVMHASVERVNVLMRMGE